MCPGWWKRIKKKFLSIKYVDIWYQSHLEIIDELGCGRRVTLFQVAQLHVNANHYAKKKVINPKSLKTPFVRHSLQIQCICVRMSMIHMEHCRHTHTQLRSDARRARLTKEKRNDKSNDRSHTRGNAERREMHMSFRVFGFALGQVR